MTEEEKIQRVVFAMSGLTIKSCKEHGVCNEASPPSGKVFEREYDGFVVQPCINHVSYYERSFQWKEVEL